MNQELKERAEQNGNRCASTMDVKFEDGKREVGYGLTKREYMATHILAGLMANPHLSKEDYRGLPESAVGYADELLEALEPG